MPGAVKEPVECTVALRMYLGAAHDKFIGDLNNKYWDATKFGFWPRAPRWKI